MRSMTRYFTLPILLGLSLTSISIATVYVLCKKDEEDIKSRKNDVEFSKQFTTECKIPRQFVPMVIGRGGSVVKDIQKKTRTQIHFRENNIGCPYRTCVIKGSYENICLAEEMIKSIVQNQPVIETYIMDVSPSVYNKLMERRGEGIQEIQRLSNAKIVVDCKYDRCDKDREIIIKGTRKQISAAVFQIENKIREEKEARIKLEVASASRLPRGKLSPRNTAISTSEQVQTNESLSLQFSDGLMEVYVSAMQSPNQFWVQIVGPGATALDKLVSEMSAYYNDEQNYELHTLKNITLGQIVAAKFSFDEQWYRAEVISTPEDGQCEVYFVDYGDHEVVQINHVLELRTDFLSLRLQAVECSLANIKPRENEWSAEACDLFAELIYLAQWKVVLAKVRGYKERALSYGRSRREGSPIPCVDLFNKKGDKDVNIGQEMVNEGFAELEEPLLSAASSTLSLSTRSHEMPTTSSPVSTSPLMKRVSTPETSAKSPCKLSATYSNPNQSVIDLETSSSTQSDHQVEEIDLITPQKIHRQVEEINLVTPVKDETSCFIKNEKRAQQDSYGRHLRNGKSNQYEKARNPRSKTNESVHIIAAGYESDLSTNSDDLELG